MVEEPPARLPHHDARAGGVEVNVEGLIAKHVLAPVSSSVYWLGVDSEGEELTSEGFDSLQRADPPSLGGMLEDASVPGALFQVDLPQSDLNNAVPVSVGDARVLIHLEGDSVAYAAAPARRACPRVHLAPRDEPLVPHGLLNPTSSIPKYIMIRSRGLLAPAEQVPKL